MSVVYKLLQSGFIAPDTSDLIQIPQEERTLMQNVITQPLFRIDTSNYYDKAVQQLYSQMAVEQKAFADFKFREEVLKKVFALFGESGFVEWVRAQKHSPCYSYLHDRFLKETVLFIYESKTRAMTHSSYYRLLHVGSGNSIFAAGKDDEDGGDLESALRNIGSHLTVDLLARWTEDMDSLHDLLSTLNVIYGRRGTAAR